MIFSVFCRQDEYSASIGDQISKSLTEESRWTRDDEQPELVICIGGDGTLLRAIHHYMDRLDSTLFVAIHTGTLGFFTDYTKTEIREFIYDLTHKTARTESYPLLECTDDLNRTYYALNEFRVGSFASTVRLEVYIDNEYFETVAGSGICIASQPGSTGASRSLNGAVIEDGLQVMQLTQIMPVTHKSQHSLLSPYILRLDRQITVYGDSLEESTLCYDHLETDRLSGVTKLRIQTSGMRVRFARFRPYSYLKRLKNLY